MNEEDMNKQLYYIRLSFSTLKLNSSKLKLGKSKPCIKFFENVYNFLDCAKEIGEMVSKYTIWSQDKKACTWWTTTQTENDYTITCINDKLYEGGGMILFFLYLWHITDDENYKQYAVRGLVGIEELGYLKESDNLSAFTGIGSSIYLYYTFYTLIKNEDYKKKLYNQVDKLIDKCREPIEEIDIISGVSGTIIVLVNIYRNLNDKIFLDCASLLGQILYDKLSEQINEHLTGFSHGYSGYALALFNIGKALRNNQYTALGEQILVSENNYYDTTQGNWKDLREEKCYASFWCHGSGGIALARSKINNIQSNLHYKEDVNRAVDDLKLCGFERGEMYNHSICHGSFGNIDILLEIAKETHNTELTEYIFKQAKEEIDYIRKHGFIAGTENLFDSNLFMLGLSGVGYSLLRLQNNSIPSILALEVIGLN